MGWLSGVPCIAKLMNANNLKAPLGSGNGLGPKATSHRLNHWWRIQLAPLEGSEFIQAWGNQFHQNHNKGVWISAMPSQITRASIVFLTFSWGADQRKHQSYASLAPVRGIHRWPVSPLTKGQWRGKYSHLMTSSCTVQLSKCNKNIWWVKFGAQVRDFN